MKNTWLAVSLLAVFISMMGVIGFSHDASAGMEVNSRLYNGNTYNFCTDGGRSSYAATKGMVWLSNDGGDYYSETVSISENATSVGIQVRGAVNSCGWVWRQSARMYAADVSSVSSRLSIRGNNFYRGELQPGSNRWTSQGGSLSGTLNVNGIAPCTGNGRVTAIETVGIFRRLQWEQGGVRENGGPGTEWVPVRVSRDCPNINWTVNGNSYVEKGATPNRDRATKNDVTALPGERVNWYHDLRNNGPTNIPTIAYSVDRTGFSAPGWNANGGAPSGRTSARVNELFIREYASNRPASAYTIYTVRQSDVGNRLCQRLAWSPQSSRDSSRGESNFACVNVPYRYSLQPTISNLTDNAPIESQLGDIEVRGSIANDGPTKSRPNVNWQLTQIVYRPSTNEPFRSDGGEGGNPCSFFANSAGAPVRRSCDPIGSGTDADGIANNAAESYLASGNITDEPVGTKICFAMSVQPYAHDANNWRHSQLYCRIVSKAPKVQVQGGDLIVGKGSANAKIATSMVRKNVTGEDRTYGSWGEYAIVASGRIYGMASGAGYSGGTTDRNYCSANYLTITNAGDRRCSDSTAKGLYQYGTTLPPIGSRFSGAQNRGANPTIDVSNAANRGILSGSGTITLTASRDVPAGQWVVINADKANVNITQDIRYTGDTLSRLDQIPQVIIIANNIAINGGVTQVDSWLVASGDSGRITTCSDVARANLLNSRVCEKILTVNGPVAARQLQLYRTGGSGTGEESGDPAEIFNLRADAYLWANYFSGTSNRLQTTSSTELPPRF